MPQDLQTTKLPTLPGRSIAQQAGLKGISVPAVIPIQRSANAGDNVPPSDPLSSEKPPFQLNRGIRNEKTVQLQTIDTSGGRWTAGGYKLGRDSSDPQDLTGMRGAEMQLVFDPAEHVDAKQIILTQAVKTHKNNAPYIVPKPNLENRTVKSGIGAGYRIDNEPYSTSPAYHSSGLEGAPENEGNRTLKDTTFGIPPDGNIGLVRSGFAGFHYRESGELETHTAALVDSPRLLDAKRNSGHTFETTALATEGRDEGTYYGSVQWGWKTDNGGNHTLLDFKVISQGTPSDNFIESAKVWNEQGVKYTEDALASLEQQKETDPLPFRKVEKFPEKDTVLPNIKLPIPIGLVEMVSDSEKIMAIFPRLSQIKKRECITLLSRIKTLIIKRLSTVKNLDDTIPFLVKVNTINDFLIEHKA